MPKVLGDICFSTMRNILILKKAIRKPPNILDEWNGYPKVFFSFSQALEISRQYLLLRTVILQNTVAGCPCVNPFITKGIKLIFFSNM